MISKVYSVYDCKAEFYSAPFLSKSRGEAIRSFTEAANDKQSSIGKYPSDFTLFELGDYDDSTAKITHHAAHVSLGCALEFISAPLSLVEQANTY